MREVVRGRGLLLLGLLGCSDPGGSESAGGSGSGSGGSTSAGSTGAGAAGSSSSGGVGSGGASGGSSSAGQNGGSSSAGSSTGGQPSEVSPAELEPLALGNLWSYTLSVVSPMPGCESGPGTREVTASLEHEGRTAFELQRFCDTEPSYHSLEGGDVWQHLGGWYRSVAAPVSEGASWAFAPGYTLVWSSAGSVTVPAGTFSDCWKRSIMEFDGSITFCPGVGQVKIELPDVTAELTSFSVAE